VGARDLPDVEQEVLRGVYRGLPAFDPALAAQPESALRGWLFGICERQAAGHRRAEVRRGEVLCPSDELGARLAGPGLEDVALAAERHVILYELLAELPLRRRAVLLAYDIEGVAMKDVALALGLPENTAWNCRRLGLEDLRRAWKRLAARRRR
ncbi:MAG: sigma-70 family RNA polymerase sigma factor, partial [Rhodocyclaceae bacterium]